MRWKWASETLEDGWREVPMGVEWSFWMMVRSWMVGRSGAVGGEYMEVEVMELRPNIYKKIMNGNMEFCYRYLDWKYCVEVIFVEIRTL